MVDQNSNSPVQNTHKPKASGSSGKADAISQPTVLKAGETMLIISLVVILVVICSVALHLFIRRRKRNRKLKDVGPLKKLKDIKKKKKQNTEPTQPSQPELHSQERKIAELPATPLCEMGESEPRHEMEDLEVPDWPLRSEAETQASSDTTSQFTDEKLDMTDSETASEMDIEIGISWYDATEDRMEPDSREFAMYWSRGI